MKINYIFISIGLFFFASSCTKELTYIPENQENIEYHGETLTITLTEPGSLRHELSGIMPQEFVTKLIISGPINGSDLKFIREMAGIDNNNNNILAFVCQ